MVGNTTQMDIAKLGAFRLALFGFVNYCFVAIVLLVGLEGAIETEGREMEENGFYGQRSVLLFLTCLFALVQSSVFISWINKRLKVLRSTGKPQPAANEYVDADDYNYNVTI